MSEVRGGQVDQKLSLIGDPERYFGPSRGSNESLEGLMEHFSEGRPHLRRGDYTSYSYSPH
jgi:hypothetical protein